MEILTYIKNLVIEENTLRLEFYENTYEDVIKNNIITLIKFSFPRFSFNPIKYIKEKIKITKAIKKIKTLDLIIAYREKPKTRSSMFLFFYDKVTKEYYVFTNILIRSNTLEYPTYLCEDFFFEKIYINSAYMQTYSYALNIDDPLERVMIVAKVEAFLQKFKETH